MASPIKLPWMNTEFVGPSPNSKIAPLPSHSDGRIVTSVWRLTPEEMSNIVENRCVVVRQLGERPQPIAITTCTDPNV